MKFSEGSRRRAVGLYVSTPASTVATSPRISAPCGHIAALARGLLDRKEVSLPER